MKNWTFTIWIMYGLILSISSVHFLIGMIGALSFALASIVTLYDFAKGSSQVRWNPLLVAYAGALGLIVGLLLFKDSSQAILWSILFLIMLRSLFSETNFPKKRKAKDII